MAAGPAVADPLAALWAASTIAVVGASSRPGAPGRLVLEHLARHGYAGRVVAVNPRGPVPGHESLAAVPDGVDLAVIVVPAAAVPAAVEDCAAAGVRCAIVGSSGFAETGPAGRAAQDDLVAVAAAKGLRLVGPNCIGSVGFHTGLVASFSPLFSGTRTRLLSGGVGFASASGALGYGAVSLALERGLGLFAAVTTGNECDVTALEALASMARDPQCTAVLGYLESLVDVDGLRALAAAGKPAALLVAGRSAAGARAAASHTGALATPDRLVDGVLRQHGIVRVHDVDELLDVGEAFSALPARVGGRVAVITTSGGSGILAADALAAHGMGLASLAPSTVDALAGVVPPYGSTANPVDVTATVMSDRTLVARCVDLVAADDAVDALVVCFCVLTGGDVDAIVDALAGALTRHRKPIVVARTGAAHLAPEARDALRCGGIPEFPTPARAVRALAAAMSTRAPGPLVASGASGDPTLLAALVSPDDAGPGARHCSEIELKAVLAARGLRVPRGQLIGAAAEAPDAVRSVSGGAAGGRAVLKVVVPGAVHKTELGGVRLGVTAEDAPGLAAELLAIDGATAVLVEEQVDGGVEVLVGIAPTPLGPALTVGAGGTLAELLDDAAVRLLPVSDVDIRAAIAETRVSALLAGHRGARPANVDALVALVRAIAHDWGGSLDLNPVLVTPHEAVVLDAAYIPDSEV